jgi:hypothetical protein
MTVGIDHRRCRSHGGVREGSAGGAVGRTEGWRHSAGMVLEVGGAVLVLLLGVSTLLASMRA